PPPEGWNLFARRNWVVRHKVWTAIVSALVFFVAVGLVAGPKKLPSNATAVAAAAPSSSSSPAPSGAAPAASLMPPPSVATTPPVVAAPTPPPVATTPAVVATTAMAIPPRASTGLAVAGSALTGSAPAPGSCHFKTSGNGRVLPDPTCTPGVIDAAVTQAGIASTICVAGYTTTVRPPVSLTNAFKVADAAAYSAVGPGELDHLVPLELGGSSDARNLWFEPGSIPNPKDAVENRLHAEVCSGLLTLAAAQLSIATDWASTSSGSATVPAPAPATTPAARAPAPTTAAPATATPAGAKVVHPGSFCTPAGATGVTTAGTPMVCKTSATDVRLRWRKA
ncbi:MAG: hypothetical protein QOJ62_2394, partial [Actinomycetota bacterium]|nr:hypothetical protein [Actinomycetota bacterium]